MNCQEFRASYLAGEVGSDDHHVLTCHSCREHLADLDAGRQVLTDPELWEEPSPELEHRVMTLIAGAPLGSYPGRGRRRLLPITAAAGLVVVLGGVAVLNRQGPDWTIEIAGTDLAPAAVATVSGWNEEAGTRIQLEVDGLDPAPPGQHYELWLSRDAVHISAGTFSGPGTAEMWAGVRRSQYPRLWITLEPADEDGGPSGVTVLDLDLEGPFPRPIPDPSGRLSEEYGCRRGIHQVGPTIRRYP